MARAKELVVKIVGDGKIAQKAFKATGNDAKNLEGRLSDSDTAASRLSKSLSRLVDPIRRVKKESQGTFSKFDVSTVDKQIVDLKSRVRDLSAEFAKTGDLSFVKAINKSKRELKLFESARKDLDKFVVDAPKSLGRLRTFFGQLGDAGGHLVVGSFKEAFSALPMIVKVPIVVGITTAVAATLPWIATALGAAVVGGVGAGGILGGIILAARNPAIKTQATNLGQVITGVLEDAAKPFVPALQDAMVKVEKLFVRLRPAFQSIFRLSADLLGPLTDGVISAIENMMPGLQRAFAAARPIFDVIASGLARVGAAVSKFFTYVSFNTTALSHALDVFFSIISGAVISLGVLIGAFAELYTWAVAAAKAMSGDVAGAINFLNQASASGAATTDRLKASEQGLTGALTSSASAAERQAQAIADANTKKFEAVSAALGARSAERDYQAAIDSASQSLKDNGKTLDINKEKGRENQEALDRIASSANALTQEMAENGASQKDVAAKVNAAKKAFVDQAVKMGESRTKAQQLADKLIAIPDVKPKVNVDESGAVRGSKNAQEAINGVTGKTVNITVGVIGAAAAKGAVAAIKASGHATGGFIQGPGSGTSDSILSWLSNGEYVIPANMVRKYGVDYFDKLRAGELPAYAKGGAVKGGKSRYATGGSYTKSFATFVSGGSLYRGLLGDLDSVKGASSKILDEVTGRLDKSVRKQLAKMQDLAKKRDAVADKLKAAKERLSNAISARDDFRRQIKDSAVQAANITTGNEEVTNASLVLDRLKKQLEKTKQFRAYLAQLQKAGINATSYRQLVEAGVDGGFATAKALIEGGGNTIGELNSLQSQLNTAADGLGSDSSKRLYQAGVDAAAGLVKGLESQAAALKKAADKMADQIIKSLKKALQIKSPSRVLRDEVGYQMGAGIAVGVDDSSGLVTSALQNATNPKLTTSGGVNASGGGQTINVYITVEGSVMTENKLAESIAPKVRDAIARKGRLNGGRTGL